MNSLNKQTRKTRISKRSLEESNLELKLFSSNNKKFIMHALGGITDIEKGTINEKTLWCVKDSTESPGNNFYFINPDEAERLLNVVYTTEIKEKWYSKQNKFKSIIETADN